MNNKIPKGNCCPQFDPSPWNEKNMVWKNKRFIKDSVRTLFYMPINFGSVMTRGVGKIEKSGAKLVEGLILSEHVSMWKMNVYMAVDKQVPLAENTNISGELVTKVYEGDFKDTGKWMKDYEKYVNNRKKTVERTFLWYTTCPGCAKKYGKNYVVILGKLK